jgi:hypothetical protein
MAAFDFPDNPVIDQTVEGSRGEVYVWDGEKWTWAPLPGGGGGEPGGPDGAIQFNDGGTFAGSGDLTWDSDDNVLEVGGDINLVGDNPQILINGVPFEPGGQPAGSTGMIQYNNFGAFGADGNLFWDVADARLGVDLAALPEYTVDVGGDVNSTGCYRIGGVEFACGDVGGGIDLTNITNLTATNISVTNINGQPASSLGPAGANTQVQWNNNGAFGASANLWWDDANARLNLSSGAYGSPGVYISEPTNARSASVYVNQVGLQILAGANTGLYLFSPDLVETSSGGGQVFNAAAATGAAFQFGTASGYGLVILPNNYVGLGKQLPAYALDVVGDVNSTGCYRILTAAFACGDGAGGVNLTNVANINGEPYVPGGGAQLWTQSAYGIYYSGGNVGIGNNGAAPFTAAGYGPFLIVGPTDGPSSSNIVLATNESSGAAATQLCFANYALPGDKRIAQLVASSPTGDITSGTLQFYTANAGVLVPGLNMAANGNVGIGTRGASDALTLNGNGIDNQLRFLGPGGTYGTIFRADGTAFYILVTDAGSQGAGFNSLRPFTLDLSTGNVSMAHTVSVGGNLGVGSYPYSKVTIDGGTTEIRTGNWLMLRPPNNAWDFEIFAGENPYTLNFMSANAGAFIMQMAAGGGVGINAIAGGSYLIVNSPSFVPGSNLNSAYMAIGTFGGGYLMQDSGFWMGMWSYAGELQIQGGTNGMSGYPLGHLRVQTTGNVLIPLGGLAVGGNTAAIGGAGDICIARNADPATGAIFFGNSAARYIFWDGNIWNITGSMTLMGGDFFCNSGSFNGIACTGSATIGGWLGVGGVAAVPDPVTITGLGAIGQIRLAYGSYGFGFRNDGNAMRFMITNPGDPWGGWGPQPIIIDLATGNVSTNYLSSTTVSIAQDGLQVSNTLNTLNASVGIGGVWPDQRLTVNGHIHIVGGGCLIFNDGTSQCTAATGGGIRGVAQDAGPIYTRSTLVFASGTSIVPNVVDNPQSDQMVVYFNYTSDVRSKQNIRPLEGGLAVINQIHPVEAEFNGLAGTRAGYKAASVIAQEVEAVFPLAVYSHRMKLDPADAEATDVLCLDPPAITFQCVLAIQELDQRVSAIEAELRERRN